MEGNNSNLTSDSGKKGNGKLIGIIVAVVAVLAVGIGAFAYSSQNKAAFKKLSGTPEEIVAAAISNTNQKSLEEQADMSEKVGMNQLEKIKEKEANEMSFNIGLQGISGIDNAEIISAYIKDAGLSGTFQSTKAGDKVNGNLKVTQSGIELLGASMYKENDEIGISIPKILDAPYAVKLDTFVEDYKNSALCQMMGGETIDEEELGEVTEILSAFGEYMNGAMNLSKNKEFMTQAEAIQSELIKNAQVKENGKKAISLSDGSEKECTVYTGSLTGEQLMDFINKEMEAVMSLDFAKNYFDVVAKQSGMTVEDMLEEFKNTAVLEEGTTVDIDFLVDDTYFRGCDVTIKQMEEEIGTFTLYYNGADYLLDGIEFTFDLQDSGETVGMDLTFTQNLGAKADVYSQNLALSIKEDNVEIGNMTYAYEFNTKEKEDNLNVSMGLDFGAEAAVSFTGSGTKTVNKDEVSTNLSTSTLSGSADGENFDLAFNLSYGVKAIKASDVTIDKTGVKYILEMSEAELTSAVQTIQSNIQAFAYGLF